MRVKIVKVPAGPAPEWVRKEWVGIELEAIIMPTRSTDLILDGGVSEIDFISKKLYPSRGGFVVEAKPALNTLKRKSDSGAAATEWFLANVSKDMNYFAFGPDEAEVLSFS